MKRVRSCRTCQATGKIGGTHQGFPATLKCPACRGRGFSDREIAHVVLTHDGVVLSGDVDVASHEVTSILAIDDATGNEVALNPEALGGVKALLVASMLQSESAGKAAS